VLQIQYKKQLAVMIIVIEKNKFFILEFENKQ